MTTRKEIPLVEIAEFNSDVSRAEVKELVRRIQFGMDDPIVLRPTSDGKYLPVDRRAAASIAAAKRMRWLTVPAFVIDASNDNKGVNGNAA